MRRSRNKSFVIMRTFIMCFILVLFIISSVGCACNSTDDFWKMDYFADDGTHGEQYDSNIFYRNDLKVFGGDADVIYVSKEEDDEYGGWFYMYTSGNDGVVLQQYSDHRSCITCLRSKDLNDWELCGKVDNGFSCWIGNDEWILERTWAPEVLRNPQNGKYYMYFSALSYWNKNGKIIDQNGKEYGEDVNSEFTPATAGLPKNDNFMGAVLVSDKPCGPFYLANSERYFNGGENANGQILSKLSPQINIYNYFHTHEIEGYEGKFLNQEFPIIDISPIYTSKGELYITFSRHRSTNHPVLVKNTNDGKMEGTSCLWVMKMHDDWVTPDYKTLTKVTDCNYKTVTRNTAYPCWDEENGYTLSGYFREDDATWELYDDGEAGSLGEGHINEGPQMFEKDGRFYLCYSPRGYESRFYDVKQAISDNGALGPYTKIPADYARVFGVNLVKNDAEKGMTSTGHHAFVEVGGELFCVYYVHADPLDGSTAARDGRIYSVDRLDFVDTEEYGVLIYGNGPTNVLQIKPNVATGLHNVIFDEGTEIDANNCDSDTIKYLADNKIIVHDIYQDMQFTADGETKITITFDTPKEISAISVYNAYQYEYAFSEIDGIIFEVAERPSWLPADTVLPSEMACITGIKFNPNYIHADESVSMPYIDTGAAVNVSFNPIKVKSVKIVISRKISDAESEIKVSEIAILGK